MATVSQAAVLPYRVTDGAPQVLLITSRGRGRWVLPKGHLMPDRDKRSSAEWEALEEAGLSGRIAERPAGTFTYRKFDDPAKRLYEVTVFPMEVTGIADDWPERSVRERRWMTFDEAAACVDERELAAMLREFGRMLDTLVIAAN